jgi:hypothetical protein
MAPIFGVAVQGKIKTTTIRYFLFLKDICVLTHSSVANFSRIFVSSPIHPLPISQGYLCPHPFIRCHATLGRSSAPTPQASKQKWKSSDRFFI